jgi:hypothetical protein
MKKSLSEIVGPEHLGIIWVESKDLSERPSLFYELDYLLDGLLTDSIKQKAAAEQSFFLGQSFNRPFFLFKGSKDSISCKQNMESLKAILDNLDLKARDILVIGKGVKELAGYKLCQF